MNDPSRRRSDPEPIRSSWDDLLPNITDLDGWERHRQTLRRRYLELLRDDRKPARPEPELVVHETVDVEGLYQRKLISYQVEADERAHAYLGVPHGLTGPVAGVVALHGTFPQGKERAAGLVDTPDKAYLDHLCRRGYVVIAPDHFVAGHRIPPEGPYETARFHEKHPDWTAVGKFTYEHSIAIDVLQQQPEVIPERIGVMGHSLGGQGTIFLAAYDDRIAAAACNCAAPFFRHWSAVEHWSRDRWYVYFKHLREGLLAGQLPPIDFHEIISLIAPRPYLDLFGLNDGDPLTQRQRVLMLTKCADVWDLTGAPANFAFYCHGRGHSIAHESRELLYGWLDTHLRPETTTTRLITP